jgi:hypothetical protein
MIVGTLGVFTSIIFREQLVLPGVVTPLLLTAPDRHGPETFVGCGWWGIGSFLQGGRVMLGGVAVSVVSVRSLLS